MPGTETWSLIRDDGTPADDLALDDRGHLALDRTVATPIITALDHELGAWWANPDHGSRIAAIRRGTPEPDQAAAITAAVRESLAPLERVRRIRDLRVHTTLDGNRATITVHAYDIARATPISQEFQS